MGDGDAVDEGGLCRAIGARRVALHDKQFRPFAKIGAKRELDCSRMIVRIRPARAAQPNAVRAVDPVIGGFQVRMLASDDQSGL